MTYSLFHLFLVFVYVGTFTIGGGLVAITLMQQSLVDTGVVSAEEFFNMVAVSESTPGPIGINMATYVGFSQYGILGALVTTAGEVLPSIICIIIVSKLFVKFHDNPYVQASFTTLRSATTGVIAVAALEVFTVALVRGEIGAHFAPLGAAVSEGAGVTIIARQLLSAIKGMFLWRGILFYAAGVAVLFKTKMHPIALVAAGAVFGAIAL